MGVERGQNRTDNLVSQLLYVEHADLPLNKPGGTGPLFLPAIHRVLAMGGREGEQAGTGIILSWYLRAVIQPLAGGRRRVIRIIVEPASSLSPEPARFHIFCQ